MKRLLQWIAEFFAGQVLLQLIASVSLAYLLNLGIAFVDGVIGVFQDLPPLFFPISAVLVFLVAGYHGVYLPVVKWRQEKEENYRNEVEQAYTYVSWKHKPEILNPDAPGNPAAIGELAQNAVDLLRPKMIARYKTAIAVPDEIDIEDGLALQLWYEFLREERVRLVK